MLQVEGKTFRKLVEKKEYRTQLYFDHCPIKEQRALSNVWMKKNGDKFYPEDIFLDEDNYVKNYGNRFADVDFLRRRVFIEEGEDKIAIKYQYYQSSRRVSDRYFRVRKITRFFTFNFKTKLFYIGTYSSKKKKKMGSSMKVNPTWHSLNSLMEALRFDRQIDSQSYVYSFLETIWDRLGLVNPQNFEVENPESFYSLTLYLVNGAKLPNNWLQLTGMRTPKKELRKADFNLVDAFMNTYGFKGAKIKKIINQTKWVDFQRLSLLFNMLGIDRFNKLDESIFSEDYSEDDQPVPYLMERRGGNYWHDIYPESVKQYKEMFKILTDNEKDRILKLNSKLGSSTLHTIIDHIEFKKTLNRYGENVKMKFNSRDELMHEHVEWTNLISSYRNGTIERYYGEVDSLETPIEHNGETYYPIILKNTEDYNKESQHQTNCVRTYTERADSIIFSIRKGSDYGDNRVTVEYQYRRNELVNIQERAKFNTNPSFEFSEVARIQLANINLLYKLGTLKLPKICKKFPNGKMIERQATFKRTEDFRTTMISMGPVWEDNDNGLSEWQNELLDYQIPVNDVDFWDDLP